MPFICLDVNSYRTLCCWWVVVSLRWLIDSPHIHPWQGLSNKQLLVSTSALLSFICQRPWLRGLLNAPQDSLRKSAFAPMEPQAQATVCPYAYCTQKTVFPNAYMPPCPTRPSMPSGPGQKGSWRRKGDSFTLIILSCFIHCGYHRYFITYILGYPKKKQKSEFFFATHPTGFHRLDEPPEKNSAL